MGNMTLRMRGRTSPPIAARGAVLLLLLLPLVLAGCSQDEAALPEVGRLYSGVTAKWSDDLGFPQGRDDCEGGHWIGVAGQRARTRV